MLGSCEPGSMRAPNTVFEETALAIKVLGNPSPNFFDIQIRGKADKNIILTVYDNLGRVIETRSSLQSNQTVRFGSLYHSGIYLVEIIQGTQKQTLKLIKTN
jgi:hypothetical protein